MRVLVATPWFPNTARSGPGSFVWDSTEALCQSGCVVSVVVARPWAPGPLRLLAHDMIRGDIVKSDFGSLAGLAIVRTPSLPRGIARRYLTPVSDELITRRLEAVARQRGADVIHAHTEGFAPAAVKAGRRLGIPVVVTLHGLNSDRTYLESPHQRARLSTALALADRVILVGEPLRAFFAAYIGREDHIKVVFNGVRVPPGIPNEILEDARRLRLVSVSNLHEGKGIDLTLRAMAELRAQGFEGVSYVVVGDGSERSRLVRLSRELELERDVQFVGQVPIDQVPAYLAKADIFVLPSYREAFGIAYLEAMASGLLTIGVEGQGPAQFIDHGETGVLVAPRDHKSVASALRDVIEGDAAHWRAVAHSGAQMVRGRFSWRAHASALRSVLEEAMSPISSCIAAAS